jgi:hypothetical protein
MGQVSPKEYSNMDQVVVDFTTKIKMGFMWILPATSFQNIHLLSSIFVRRRKRNYKLADIYHVRKIF